MIRRDAQSRMAGTSSVLLQITQACVNKGKCLQQQYWFCVSANSKRVREVLSVLPVLAYRWVLQS